jgi:hypothetical protein
MAMNRPHTASYARVRDSEQPKVIDRLFWLRRRIYQYGNAGLQHRIEFLCLAFKHDLVWDICHFRLWDEGWEELGERQWDTCFEMGDSERVIPGAVTLARQESYIDAIRDYCTTAGAFERWLRYADRQAALF